MSATAHPRDGAPRQTLPGIDAFAVTVGIVIGAGVFRTPALVAEAAGSEAAVLLAWVAGGLLSIIGALCYAELASAFPSAGGDYHFLDRAFGPRLAFLYGWARLAVIQTGSLALLAFIVGDYLASAFPVGPWSSPLYAAATVLVLTGINRAGVREGAGVQRWLTTVEVGGLVAVSIAGFLAVPAADPPPPSGTGAGGVGMMMVFVLLTYGGWSEAAYLSAEVKGSRRRLGWIMVAGLALVTALYVLANAAFLHALGLAGVAQADAVASAVMERAFGSRGAAVMALIVAVAALTSANATAITGARTAFALGRTYPQLGWLGEWDTRRDTPGNALLLQGAVALLLVGLGGLAPDGFRLIVEYTAPVFWTFLLLAGVALFVLRRRHPEVERPFRVPLYPLTPALFCLTSAYLLHASLAYTGWGALAGVAVVGIGCVLLLFLKPEVE